MIVVGVDVDVLGQDVDVVGSGRSRPQGRTTTVAHNQTCVSDLTTPVMERLTRTNALRQ